MTTEERVLDVVQSVVGGEPNPQTLMTEFDSLDLVEIAMELEEEFDLRIPEDDSHSWETVGDIIEYIPKKLNE